MGQKYIDINFDDLNVNTSKLLDYRLNLKEDTETSAKICKNYSVYGYCNVEACAKSHDIELILKNDLMKKEKQNFQKLISIQESVKADEAASKFEQEKMEKLTHDQSIENKIHTAGLDAFMTGYVMLDYMNKFSKFVKKEIQIEEEDTNSVKLEHFINLEEFNFNVYLTGKEYPLLIKKSNFASTSLNHQEKKQRTDSNP